jgi:hypothetical protein
MRDKEKLDQKLSRGRREAPSGAFRGGTRGGASSEAFRRDGEKECTHSLT